MNLEPVQVFIHTPESNGSVLIKACDQAEKQSELPVKRSPPQPIYAGSGPLPSLLQGLIEIIVSNTNQIDGGAREAVGRLARTLGERLPVTALKALGGYVGEKLGDVATQAVAEAWSDANAAISPANELVGQIKDVIVRADGQTLLELCELTVDSLSPVRLLLPLKGGAWLGGDDHGQQLLASFAQRALEKELPCSVLVDVGSDEPDLQDLLQQLSKQVGPNALAVTITNSPAVVRKRLSLLQPLAFEAAGMLSLLDEPPAPETIIALLGCTPQEWSYARAELVNGGLWHTTKPAWYLDDVRDNVRETLQDDDFIRFRYKIDGLSTKTAQPDTLIETDVDLPTSLSATDPAELPLLSPKPSTALIVDELQQTQVTPGTVAASNFAEQDVVEELMIPGYVVEGEFSGLPGLSSYLAVNQRSNRAVVLKIFDANVSESDRFRKTFDQDLRAARTLRNKSIQRTLDYGEVDGHVYAVVEKCDGRPLQSILDEEETLEPERCAKIAMDIANALAYAHSLEVVHGRLSVGCLALLGDEDVVICDFGVARLLNPLPHDKSMLGHGFNSYLSEKQPDSEPFEKSGDFHALGTILYEIAVGEPPVYVPSGYKRMDLASPHQVDPEVPESLSDPIVKLLDDYMFNRYRDRDLKVLLSDLARVRGAQVS